MVFTTYMRIVQNPTSISVYNNENTEFEFHKNGDCFQIAPEDTSTGALYFNPNTRINTYEKLQEVGKFTDQEITLIRLRVGEIKNWNKQWRDRMNRAGMTLPISDYVLKIDHKELKEYCEKDIESVTKALKASGLYTMQQEEIERIKSKVMLNTIYGKTTI